MAKIQLTKEQLAQIGAGILFGGLFIGLYVFYFWIPYAKAIEENTAKVESMKRDIDNAERQKAKFKDLEGKLESLRQEKEAAVKKLPSEKRIPDLIRTVTRLSKKYKVTVLSINPLGQAKVEYFTKVNYQIMIRGNYHDIGRFLTALGLEERILTSENLVMNAGGGADASISGTFILAAYQYNG